MIMEYIFYHSDTRIDYHVVEFDPAQVSWEQFRRNMLGETDASKAANSGNEAMARMNTAIQDIQKSSDETAKRN